MRKKFAIFLADNTVTLKKNIEADITISGQSG